MLLLVSKYNLFIKNNITYLKLSWIVVLKLIEFYYCISLVILD
jgi:hypothetical protein